MIASTHYMYIFMNVLSIAFFFIVRFDCALFMTIHVTNNILPQSVLYQIYAETYLQMSLVMN